MARLSRSKCRARNNKGQHQRRRSSRGFRLMSKFIKYKYYNEEEVKNASHDNNTKRI
jgi:hypothetical protein